jgi:tRNA nucleotidyltransferase (CCA-adding enzyme)
MSKYAPPAGYISHAKEAASQTYSTMQRWAGQYLEGIYYSGSYTKGTNIRGGSDLDLFISLNSSTPGSMKDVYFGLLNYLEESGFNPIRQNVSIGIKVNELHVDLIPAVVQKGYSYYHTIYRSKADTWTQTNIHKHIELVKDSNRLNEIKIAKIWTKLHNLNFPSFYLEMVVITNALYDKPEI